VDILILVDSFKMDIESRKHKGAETRKKGAFHKRKDYLDTLLGVFLETFLRLSIISSNNSWIDFSVDRHSFNEFR
jgi:hypothetical protein